MILRNQLGAVILVSVLGNTLAFASLCGGFLNPKETVEKLNRISLAEKNALKPTEINYRVDGAANAETIILIHGLGSDLDTFKEVRGPLAKKYRVISYDQRGHGQTVARGDDYSTYQMAADLKSLVDHLGVKQFHLLGHSLGARTAMRFADMYPHLVKSLLIEDMDMRKRQDDSPEKVAKMNRYAHAVSLMKPFYQNIKDAIIQLLPEFKDDVERTAKYLIRVGDYDEDTGSLDLRRALVTIYYGFQGNVDDFASTLQNLTVPILFLRADPKKSPFFDDAGVEHIRANAKNYQIIDVPGARHTIHIRPTLDIYMNALNRFLESHP